VYRRNSNRTFHQIRMHSITAKLTRSVWRGQFIYLSICCWRNDAVSCWPPNFPWSEHNKSQRKQWWPNLMFRTSVCMKGISNARKILGLDYWSPGRNGNRQLPQYETGFHASSALNRRHGKFNRYRLTQHSKLNSSSDQFKYLHMNVQLYAIRELFSIPKTLFAFCVELSWVEFILRPTVSQPLHLGIGLPFGAHNQILSLSFL
jgi:hypothetical protein